MIAKLKAKLQSPVFFLTVANLFSAAVGFVSGMLTARWLGAGAYGVMGIISAINGTALNFVDLRLSDVMAKMYFRKDLAEGEGAKRFRASLIQSSLLCYGGLSAFFFFLGLIANLFLPRFFTSQPVHWTWALCSAAGSSITYFVNPIGYMQRLTGRFRLLGWQTMAGSILSSGMMVLCVFLQKSLDGYYLGFLLANFCGAALAVGLALYAWIRLDGLPILGRVDLSALKVMREHSRFLMWGNFLGYIKLGHRSADVLLVGYFYNDSVTGLYKFARTLTDKFYMLFDAMNQVYFPTFMQMLSQGAAAAYRRMATRILVATLVFTLAILGVEYLGLPYFMTLVLKGKFAGVEPIIMIMTIPFFFVTGMYIWMWPLVLHHNLAGRFTVFSVLAVLAQYAVGILGFGIFQRLEAFPSGYVGHYVLLITLLGVLVYRRFSEMVPFGGPGKAKK